jgi:tight adherence protein C
LQGVRKALNQAGMSIKPEAFMALRIIGALLGAMLGWFLYAAQLMEPPMDLVGPFMCVLLGWMYPSVSMKRRLTKRVEAMQQALPGTLDILAISMEAGLSFDMALSKVCESESGPLVAELAQVLTEIRLGRPRGDAMLAMADRNDIDDISTFLRAVVQAEPLGVSISNVLHIQSDEMRRRRRQRAEEKGHKAPVKMLLPMMGCIFPTIFIVLLGPAVLTVIASGAGGK